MASESTYQVLAIRYGSRRTAKSENYLGYHVYGEADAEITMDYFFWVVRNADRTVVVDTGFDRSVGERRGRTMLREPAEALAALGVDPRGVDQVVVTHAHYDHIGNLGLFPDAEIVVNRRELAFWTGPYAHRLQFAAPTEPAELRHLEQIRDQGRLTLADDSQRLAPGIELVRVGGHTPGQLVVLAATEAGAAVLASDAIHFYEEYERDRPFSVLSDLQEMYHAYDLLREMTADTGRALVAGHDPAVVDRFPPLDENRPDLAVRIT